MKQTIITTRRIPRLPKNMCVKLLCVIVVVDVVRSDFAAVYLRS
jgi:hypothetical protein